MLTTPSNVLALHLKQIFPFTIWIFTEVEGDGIESRLPFKIVSSLLQEWVLLTKIYLFRIYNQLLDSNPNSSIIKIDEEIQKQAQNNESEQQKQQQSLPQPQQSSKNDKVGPMIIFLFVSCWFLGIFG